MTTSQYQYIDSTGIIVADTSATLAEVESEFQQAFGADLVTDPSTPQGVLIVSETVARNNVINNNAALANQINPNICGGVLLDAILAMTGIERDVQQPTTVQGVTVTGLAGTVIAAGSQASTAAGDLFATTASVTIPSGGSTTVNFQSVAYGPIPCAANALNVIVSGILGWETVNNASAGTLGSFTQSDQAARAYRLNTLAFQGVALAVAQTSALYETPGVSSLKFLENYNSTPQGMLISITGGSTLSGQIWGMTTTSGSGVQNSLIVDTDPMNFAVSLQTLPVVNPWPVAAFSTTSNISLSGLGTQSGGDWASGLSSGQIILVKNQTTASQNGLWLCESGSWSRQPYNAAASVILPSNSGISLIPNSVYACVNGGTNTAVAAALLENKSSGCAWNGSTNQGIVEPASGQTYNVLFDRPTSVPMQIEITVSGASSANVTQALLDYAAGNVTAPDGTNAGFTGFVVGASVSPFELAAAVAVENPGCYISSLTISYLSPTTFVATPLPIGFNQIATISSGNITVTISS